MNSDWNGILTGRFDEDAARFASLLRTGESFDLNDRRVEGPRWRFRVWTLDGLTRPESLEKLLSSLTSAEFREGGEGGAARFAEACLPSGQVKTERSLGELAEAVLSGCTVVLSDAFGPDALYADLRTYPVRDSEEPENDKVMRGSRDGFVENILTNVSLIRRRIRTPSLSVRRIRVGSGTRTDVAVLWMEGRADGAYVRDLAGRIAELKTDSLVLGHQSLAEALSPRGWLNPFPKLRTTERPDTAAAALLEGGVVVLCDNTPEAMLFPVTLFHFLQETDDFCFSPLTGTYLRLLRHAIFWLTMIVTPLWLLCLNHAELLPPSLHFLIPHDPGDLPIPVQLIVTEFALDGLKLASLNTPDVLASSLSVVGGLLLGDFAVTVGWLSPDVILYMAFVAIANFTQSSYELGYAFKYLRVLTLLLTAAFDWIGFLAGIAAGFLLAAFNRTVDGRRRYLWPLLPWDGDAVSRLVLRLKKRD